jgi:flagellar hook assembly protein FlgD
VVCYIGAAPSFGQTVAPKLIAAWGRKQAVSVEKIEAEARQFELFQNYPNPFNGTTNFGFRIPIFGFVSMKVHDVLGREVATIVHENRSAGTHVVQWDGRDERGHTLPSGVYLFSLRAGPLVTTRKAILTK